MRALRNFTGLLFGIVIGMALTLKLAGATEPQSDIPHMQPKTATGFITCENGHQALVAVILTYPDGTVVRLSKDDTHGLTAEEMVKLGSAAADAIIYATESCRPHVST